MIKLQEARTENTFARVSDGSSALQAQADVLAHVDQILTDIRRGFNISDRSVSYVSVERTNDGNGWKILYGSDYPES